MLYALFGVPLMLMCLSSLGGFLADGLQCTWHTYSKLCRARNGNNENEMHECIQEEDEVSSCNVNIFQISDERVTVTLKILN